MQRPLLFFLFSLGLWSSACSAVPASSENPEDRQGVHRATAAPSLEWLDWELASFERAAAEDKLILVDVGIEGCTACRWMDERTYPAPEVAGRLAEHFVTIAVDAESRPDVGERYASWGWPALIFLRSDGTQVLAIQGNKNPKNFVTILDELIGRHQRGTLGADGEAPIEVPSDPLDVELAELRDRVVTQLDSRYDETHAGWGRRLRSPLGAAVEHAYLRAKLRGEPQWSSRATATAAAYRALIDPEWGGVFVAAVDPDGKSGWDKTIPEKRIAGQAGALRAFALAHQAAPDIGWIEAADAVDRYLRGPLGHDDGTFHTSQEDVAPGLPDDMDAAAYYRLPDAARRQYGTPPVDHAVYTDKNAAVISAYAQMYVATGDDHWRRVAVRAGEALVARRQTDEGWFVQTRPNDEVVRDDRMRPLHRTKRPYLVAQGPMGLALLDLYRITGEGAWLQRADALAEGLRSTLEDPEAGGFFSRPAAAVDRILPRRKPVEPNAAAGYFFATLATYRHHDQALESLARRTIKAVAHPEAVRAQGRQVGQLALVLERLIAGGVELSVVGDPEDPEARALWSAAVRVSDPRAAVHWDTAGHYPRGSGPSVFICSVQRCSAPVRDPDDIAAVAASFATSATSR